MHNDFKDTIDEAFYLQQHVYSWSKKYNIPCPFLQFTTNNTLNAQSSIFTANILNKKLNTRIVLTKADFKYLTKHEICAMLSHEMGHCIYWNKQNRLMRVITDVIQAFITLSLIMLIPWSIILYLFYKVFPLTMDKIPSMDKIPLMNQYIYIIFAICLVYYFCKSKHQEYKADKIGEQLVGKKAMVDLFSALRKKDYEKDKQSLQQIWALRYTPSAFIISSLIYFIYWIKKRLTSSLHFAIHNNISTRFRKL